jgi:heme O synthase-like polyprenyltransferase
MKNRKKQITNLSNRELIIILLLFTFCFLVIILGIETLYDLVRNCIIAILIVYFGWRGMSRGNIQQQDNDNSKEDNHDE